MKIDEIKYNRDWFYQKYIVDNLTTREIADIIGCSHGAVYKKLTKFGLVEQAKVDKSRQEEEKLTPEPKITPKEETPILYAYETWWKTYYVDANSPSQQRQAREFRVRVLAVNEIDAGRLAEIEARKTSAGEPYERMTRFGALSHVVPPRKKNQKLLQIKDVS